MKVGLVGFAGSGKTTVFNTLTGLAVPTGFGGDVHLGTVKVPDARIDALSRIFSPKKTTYATIDFVDIAGAGSTGGAFAPDVLQNMRNADVLVHVVNFGAGHLDVAQDNFPVHEAGGGDADIRSGSQGGPVRRAGLCGPCLCSE